MILVTMGASRPFDRLAKEVDSIAGRSNYDFLIQLNHTEYEPKNCKFFRFKPHNQMISLIKESEFVISHGGCGSIFDALSCGKSVIAVPKTFELDETDNDQTELVQFLEDQGKITGVYDINDLEETIRNFRPEERKVVHKSVISDAIKDYLEGIFCCR